jgi:hypothetical protein
MNCHVNILCINTLESGNEICFDPRSIRFKEKKRIAENKVRTFKMN